MEPHTSTCAHAIDALESALRDLTAPRLNQEAAEHMDACAGCQAALLLTLRRLAVQVPQPTDEQDCTTCLRDLAAYIDYEAGASQAARQRYPAVWEHIWSCADCAGAYLSSRSLLDEERAGVLPPLHMPRQSLRVQAKRLIQRITIGRQLLRLILPPPQLAGAMRSGSDQSYVLYEDTSGDPPRQVTIVVREEDATHWQLIVTVTPPLRADLQLRIGTAHFRTAFDTAGAATLPHIPAQLVTDPDFPDIAIELLGSPEAA